MALKRYYLVRHLSKRKAPKPPKGGKKVPPKGSKPGGGGQVR